MARPSPTPRVVFVIGSVSLINVWCVPFSGTVGLFNKLQTQKFPVPSVYSKKYKRTKKSLTSGKKHNNVTYLTSPPLSLSSISSVSSLSSLSSLSSVPSVSLTPYSTVRRGHDGPSRARWSSRGGVRCVCPRIAFQTLRRTFRIDLLPGVTRVIALKYL